MAASQRQLQRYIYLRNSTLQILTVTSCERENELLWIILGKGFCEKCKHTEIALNVIQKQYFSSKNPFSFHYSPIATP